MDNDNAIFPKVVKLDDGKHLIMWNICSTNWNTDNPNTYYSVVDDYGKTLMPVTELPYTELNGFDTLRYNAITKRVYWAADTNNKNLTLYSFNPFATGQIVQIDSSASAWAIESIHKSLYAGIVPIDMQREYTKNITRAEFCELVVQYIEAVSGDTIARYVESKGIKIDAEVFTDTNDSAVLAVSSLGIVNGIGDNKFDPNGELTREQAAVILSRLLIVVAKPLPDATSNFSDVSNISDWARADVGKVQGKGIMAGVGNNKFDPQGKYTREQSIATILRIWDLVHD